MIFSRRVADFSFSKVDQFSKKTVLAKFQPKLDISK